MILACFLLLPVAGAVDETEDFESYNLAGASPELTPDQDWYDFRRNGEWGNVSADQGVLDGAQSFKFFVDEGIPPGNSKVSFNLAQPFQVDSTTFFIDANAVDDNPRGTRQVIQLFSATPRRVIAEFYVLCDNETDTGGCQFNVKHERQNTRGEELIPAANLDTVFKVHLVFDWRAGNYNLFVDDVDDGVFQFLELPTNLAGVELNKVDQIYAAEFYFDNWTVAGLPDSASDVVEGDMATGVKNFADDIRFRSDASRFVLGLVILVIILGGLASAMNALGDSPRMGPILLLFGLSTVLWLTLIGFWPLWVDLALMTATAALVAQVVRKVALGMKDANTSSGAIMGAFGYFIAASSLLALSGFAAQTIQVPAGDVENENNLDEQGQVAQILECSWSLLTFWDGDIACDKKVETKLFKVIDDLVAWSRAAGDFLFQLLTFQLPIPPLWNAIIVLPPAAVLAVEGFKLVRG